MIRLLNGDCLEVLAGMAPESIDEFGIADFFVENGGKHPNIVYRQDGVEHRFPMPSTGITRGKDASRYVAGNLRRKLRGVS